MSLLPSAAIQKLVEGAATRLLFTSATRGKPARSVASDALFHTACRCAAIIAVVHVIAPLFGTWEDVQVRNALTLLLVSVLAYELIVPRMCALAAA